MRLLLKICLFIFASSAYAQNSVILKPGRNNEVDSLKAVIRSMQNDTLLMEATIALSNLDRWNYDSILYYSDRGLTLAQKLGLKLWEAKALVRSGWCHIYLGNYSQSLQNFQQALAIAEDLNSERNIWKISAFTTSDNARQARISVLRETYLNMAILFLNTGDFNKSKVNYQRALDLALETNDHITKTMGYGGLSYISSQMGSLDSAEDYAVKSILHGDSAQFIVRSYMYERLANIAALRGDSTAALANYYEAMKWGSGEGLVYNELSRFYFSKNRMDSSYHYALLGLRISDESSRKRVFLRSLEQLFKIHETLGQKDSALIYLKQYKVLNDSLYSSERIKHFQNIAFEEQLRAQELQTSEDQLKNKFRLNTLLGGSFTLVVIALLLYRSNRAQKKSKRKTEIAYERLKSTQSQLIQSEKMASLGELTAGIAHEIQNPLNFVNNFSEVNSELLDELEQAAGKGDLEEIKKITKDIKDNEQKIVHHGKRADGIVKGMLQHSRASSGRKELTDINALCDEYLRLAFHGMRAKDKSFNAKYKTDFDTTLPKVEVVPQDIGRVVLNLITNAFYAVHEKNKVKPDGFDPTVTVSTKKEGDKVLISVKDNGNGIPDSIKDKIFQPFFTTKPTGQGTGLGLSLSYDIVKAHGGELRVESRHLEGLPVKALAEAGSEFIIQLPERS